jgi:hypothetical protein
VVRSSAEHSRESAAPESVAAGRHPCYDVINTGTKSRKRPEIGIIMGPLA